jgi:hypothetical protein
LLALVEPACHPGHDPSVAPSLVTRKWRRVQPGGGCPPLSSDVVALIRRLARENPRWASSASKAS